MDGSTQTDRKPFSIHDRGSIPPLLPFPSYRPPPEVTDGPPRCRRSIVSGPLIHNDEGRRWFKETYNIELAEHGGQDMNVNLRLDKLLREKGIDAYGVHSASRRLELIDDFLVVTHVKHGPFIHTGPENVEEVLEEDRKPIPGAKEEKVKADLLSKLGITKFDPNLTIHDRGAPEGQLPFPWYRPPPEVTEGPRRLRSSIVGGLLISNDEGRRWYKEMSNIELADHHRQDRSVNLKLAKQLVEKGIDAYDACTAPRRFDIVHDFLVITHIVHGPFIHDGPEHYEEVLDEDRKPTPGAKEEKAKADLLSKLGIKTCGYKSYYSSNY
ncbi:hypothetical protein H0H92_002732 [Tricholoma furcatifolium]|nr:hypothetical protein H0H92_002732 [Tricholoma furcatifolium]